MSAPFVAVLTPASVDRPVTSTGRRSTIMRGCLVERAGSAPLTRTVAVFGAFNSAVARRMATGRPIALPCRHDGGSIRAVRWPPREEAVASEADA